jgi:porphobilinogen synthase
MLFDQDDKTVSAHNHDHAHPRPRRLRVNANMRRLVRETSLSPSDFIYPLFVRHGRDIEQPISSMPPAG